MDNLTLELSPRDVVGKKVKLLRLQGLVPVHFYGAGTEPLAMQVEGAVLRRVLPRAGTNVPITIEIADGGGGEYLLREGGAAAPRHGGHPARRLSQGRRFANDTGRRANRA